MEPSPPPAYPCSQWVRKRGPSREGQPRPLPLPRDICLGPALHQEASLARGCWLPRRLLFGSWRWQGLLALPGSIRWGTGAGPGRAAGREEGKVSASSSSMLGGVGLSAEWGWGLLEHLHLLFGLAKRSRLISAHGWVHEQGLTPSARDMGRPNKEAARVPWEPWWGEASVWAQRCRLLTARWEGKMTGWRGGAQCDWGRGGYWAPGQRMRDHSVGLTHHRSHTHTTHTPSSLFRGPLALTRSLRLTHGHRLNPSLLLLCGGWGTSDVTPRRARTAPSPGSRRRGGALAAGSATGRLPPRGRAARSPGRCRESRQR